MRVQGKECLIFIFINSLCNLRLIFKQVCWVSKLIFDLLSDHSVSNNSTYLALISEPLVNLLYSLLEMLALPFFLKLSHHMINFLLFLHQLSRFNDICVFSSAILQHPLFPLASWNLVHFLHVVLELTVGGCCLALYHLFDSCWAAVANLTWWPLPEDFHRSLMYSETVMADCIERLNIVGWWRPLMKTLRVLTQLLDLIMKAYCY